MVLYRKVQSKRFNQPNGKIPLPDRLEFINLYENHNKSRKELAFYYGVHKGTIDNWCKIFKVKKTKHQQVENAVKSSKSLYREGKYNELTFQNNPELKTQNGIFYIIKLFNDEEVFYKFGISKLKNTNLRYKGRLKKYNYQVLIEKSMKLYDAFLIENIFKDLLLPNYYLPKHKFNGWTECFSYTNSHPFALQESS